MKIQSAELTRAPDIQGSSLPETITLTRCTPPARRVLFKRVYRLQWRSRNSGSRGKADSRNGAGQIQADPVRSGSTSWMRRTRKREVRRLTWTWLNRCPSLEAAPAGTETV